MDAGTMKPNRLCANLTARSARPNGKCIVGGIRAHSNRSPHLISGINQP